jgi:DNA-damage-inducible protein J
MSNKTDRIQVRVDPDLKAAAEAIFSRLGLSSGEAIRMFYSQVELQGGLPFPVRFPNKKTIEAMEETEEPSGLKRYGSFADIRKEQGV